jgi:hypothetical protein
MRTAGNLAQVLDRYFGNVCELDLIFNFHKAYYILDELLIAGEQQETSKKAVIMMRERERERERLYQRKKERDFIRDNAHMPRAKCRRVAERERERERDFIRERKEQCTHAARQVQARCCSARRHDRVRVQCIQTCALNAHAPADGARMPNAEALAVGLVALECLLRLSFPFYPFPFYPC